jgi:hypothetical protein
VAHRDAARPGCADLGVLPALAADLEFLLAHVQLGDPGAHLIARALQAASGHRERGVGRLEVGRRPQRLLHELVDAVALQGRVGEHGLRLAHRGGGVDVELFGAVVRVGDAELGARLVEGGLHAVDIEVEVAAVECRQQLACLHRIAEVDAQIGEAAGDLEAELEFVLRL